MRPPRPVFTGITVTCARRDGQPRRRTIRASLTGAVTAASGQSCVCTICASGTVLTDSQACRPFAGATDASAIGICMTVATTIISGITVTCARRDGQPSRRTICASGTNRTVSNIRLCRVCTDGTYGASFGSYRRGACERTRTANFTRCLTCLVLVFAGGAVGALGGPRCSGFTFGTRFTRTVDFYILPCGTNKGFFQYLLARSFNFYRNVILVRIWYVLHIVQIESLDCRRIETPFDLTSGTCTTVVVATGRCSYICHYFFDR